MVIRRNSSLFEPIFKSQLFSIKMDRNTRILEFQYHPFLEAISGYRKLVFNGKQWDYLEATNNFSHLDFREDIKGRLFII